jgi:hypothetical protein
VKGFAISLLVGALLIALLLSAVSSGAPLSAAQNEDATPAATPLPPDVAAELADLRNRVAVLSTRVAELGGVDVGAIAGRLGGSRAGFDDRYGTPSAYLAADEVAYGLPGLGRAVVTFSDDQATTIVVSPPREPDAPLDQPDLADWPEDVALSAAAQFAPADATMGEPVAVGERAFTVSGASVALTTAIAPSDTAGCPASGAAPFTANFTRSSPDTVSAVVLETTPPDRAALVPTAPVPASQGRLRQGSTRAVANSTLGGTINVNGIGVVATAAHAGAEGARPPADGYQFVTVDLQIANQTAQPLDYELSDFILLDRRENEATAICGGVEPAITRGQLAPGATLSGIVSFEVPEKFRAERLVILLGGARAGFLLR